MISDVRAKSATRLVVLLGIFGFAFSGNAQMNFTNIKGYLDQGVDHSAIAFGDIDRDGDLDVFITGATGRLNKFGLYQMNSQGFYHGAAVTPPVVATRYGSADFEDVDNDGFTDLLVTGQTVEGVAITRLYRNYYARFTEVPNTPFANVTSSAVVFSDFNDDGSPDVIIAGSNDGIPVTNLYYNDGQGGFSLSAQNNFMGVKAAAIAVADVDGDNDKDILISGITSEMEYVSLLYRNDGGIFSKVEGTPFTGIADGSLAFGDIESDNDMDLMLMGVGSDGTAVAELYRNNGAGVFSVEGNTPFPKVPDPQVAMEDFDLDGDLDMFMRGQPYITHLYVNDGTGIFTKFLRSFKTAFYGSFEVADLNRDGLSDILMTGAFSNEGFVTYLIRNTTVLNKPPTVSEVKIAGIPEVGEELQGSYTFFDEDGDEDHSIYRWYKSDYASGINRVPVSGAYSVSYTPTAADANKYLSIEVTPHDGTIANTVVPSSFIGPVKIPVPDIGLTGNGLIIENATGVPSLENNTRFDEVNYATGNSTKTFAIVNSGRAELLVSAVTVSGAQASEFDLALENFPVSIGPGEEFGFSIKFGPSEAGERNGLVSIMSNDADEEIYTFEVSGKGLNALPEFISEENINFLENGKETLLDVDAGNGNGGVPDEEITYSITGGADMDKFFLDAASGLLAFIFIPDFEAPTDADLNNEYLLEITADDGHLENNFASQMISVVVMNVDEAPVAICSETITVQLNGSGETTITATDVDGGSSDDSGEFSITVTPDRFTCSDVGANQVTLSVTDLNGNISTCMTTVIIEDNMPPEVLTQNVEIYLDSEGKASITPTSIDNGSSDICGIATMSVYPDSFTCGDVGPNTVTLTVTDNNGNVNSATAIVTVIDNFLPVIAGLENVNVGNQEGKCGAVVEISAPEVSDNCDVGELKATRSDGLALSDLFPVGTTTITWTVEDLAGNPAIPVIQQVNVADNDLPVPMTRGIEVVLNTAGSAEITTSDIDYGSYDNCGIKSISISQSIFTCADLGSKEIILTVVDDNGNESEATATVIIVENQLPKIEEVDNIDVASQDGKCGAIINIAFPGVTDNCSVEELVGKRSDDLPLTAVFPVGKTIITWSVKDLYGNEAEEVVQTVIVRDNNLPVLSEVTNISAYTNGQCGAYINIIAPSVSDDCQTGVVSGIRNDGHGLDDIFLVGRTLITWSVSDINLNDAVPVTQVIEVVDKEPPVIAFVEEIKAESQPDLCGAILEIAFPEVSDNCSMGSPGATRSDHLLLTDVFPVGETDIVWTVQDENGNLAEEVVQKVIVSDNTEPVISEVANVTAYTGSECGSYVNLLHPAVSDDCETGALIGTRDDGKDLNDIFQVGRTVVTWTVEDKNGNSAQPVFQEIEVLNEPPREVILSTVDVPQEIGTAITVQATFKDENIFSAHWKAFNGNSVVQEVVDGNVTGNEASHTFYDLPAGVYSIVLELKDHCGLSSGETIFEYVVIYDPNGGFVTGGGWIISPENPAYHYMQHSGKANFGFNAKYKNGNNDMHEVGGNTIFQFKAGDLHFKSSSHDDMSLVISGGYKATYKGKGTINGMGNYKFMLTAIDAGQNYAFTEDLFRIKIWEAESNKVVYDNNIKGGYQAEADNADPVTTIGGGSIVIHKPKSNFESQQEVQPVPEILPDNFLEVMQIYPNPMNSRAIVMFNLQGTSSEADVRIYDMNGKEMMQLFHGRVEKSKSYEVVLERGSLMAGIYICRLTTDHGKVYQKRLILE